MGFLDQVGREDDTEPAARGAAQVPTSAFRGLLIKAVTDPAFAAAVRADPDLLRREFGLAPAEAGVVAAAAVY